MASRSMADYQGISLAEARGSPFLSESLYLKSRSDSEGSLPTSTTPKPARDCCTYPKAVEIVAIPRWRFGIFKIPDSSVCPSTPLSYKITCSFRRSGVTSRTNQHENSRVPGKDNPCEVWSSHPPRGGGADPC